MTGAVHMPRPQVDARCPGGLASRVGELAGVSVVSPGCRLHSWGQVTDSVLFDGVLVQRYAQVHRAIIDKYVVIPERCRIGLDHDHDRARGFTVTESGITVVPKGAVITE